MSERGGTAVTKKGKKGSYKNPVKGPGDGKRKQRGKAFPPVRRQKRGKELLLKRVSTARKGSSRHSQGKAQKKE